jgi:TatD DNase family protein
MLHIRNNPKDKTKNAYYDVYELLKKYPKVAEDGLPQLPQKRGVSHFFAGDVEDMKRFMEIGVLVSFAGPITFPPKIEICDYEKVIKETPLEMIMADTDSPYVAPMPHRGKRNEPIYIKEIVKKIAEIKNLPEAEIAKAIIKNAKALFDI